MREILRRRFAATRHHLETPPLERRPVLSFGSWDELTPGDPSGGGRMPPRLARRQDGGLQLPRTDGRMRRPRPLG